VLQIEPRDTGRRIRLCGETENPRPLDLKKKMGPVSPKNGAGFCGILDSSKPTEITVRPPALL